MSLSFRLRTQLGLLLALLLASPALFGGSGGDDDDDDDDVVLQCEVVYCDGEPCGCAPLVQPAKLAPASMPQLVMLTYEGETSSETYSILSRLRQGLDNPNGCRIPMTIFVSTPTSDQQAVARLWQEGDEIGVYARNRNVSVARLLESRDWISTKANIPMGKVIGVRSPKLYASLPTRRLMAGAGIRYDSSASNSVETKAARLFARPFPYTDSASEASTTALWQLPHLDLQPSLERAHMMASLYANRQQSASLSQALILNLLFSYNGNRAPITVGFDASKFMRGPGAYEVDEVVRFLKFALHLPDVWFVSGSQLLRFMIAPESWPSMVQQTSSRCQAQPDSTSAAASTTAPESSSIGADDKEMSSWPAQKTSVSGGLERRRRDFGIDGREAADARSRDPDGTLAERKFAPLHYWEDDEASSTSTVSRSRKVSATDEQRKVDDAPAQRTLNVSTSDSLKISASDDIRHNNPIGEAAPSASITRAPMAKPKIVTPKTPAFNPIKLAGGSARKPTSSPLPKTSPEQTEGKDDNDDKEQPSVSNHVLLWSLSCSGGIIALAAFVFALRRRERIRHWHRKLQRTQTLKLEGFPFRNPERLSKH